VTLFVSTRLPGPVRDELRLAGDALGVDAADFTDGMALPAAAVALVAGLPAGARRVPADLARLASRNAVPLVLCTSEPMVRPVTTLLGGRVVLIAPPFDPLRLRSGLRAAAVGAAIDAGRFVGAGGQSLTAEWWAGWARHPSHEGGVEVIESAIDVTLVVGARGMPAQTEQIDDVFGIALDDDALERDLGATVGEAGVLRLAPTQGEWIAYWPPAAGALWLCSPRRAPARWCLSRAIAATGRRLSRLPAYPGDVMVVCDRVSAVEGIVAAVERGAAEAYATLRAAAAEARLCGAIVEAR
jgi:hypothetical protein